MKITLDTKKLSDESLSELIEILQMEGMDVEADWLEVELHKRLGDDDE